MWDRPKTYYSLGENLGEATYKKMWRIWHNGNTKNLLESANSSKSWKQRSCKGNDLFSRIRQSNGASCYSLIKKSLKSTLKITLNIFKKIICKWRIDDFKIKVGLERVHLKHCWNSKIYERISRETPYSQRMHFG